MKHIKKIKIDIDKKNFETITSVQYDSNTRFLHINILNGSVPFDITGCNVKISGSKPDGTAIFNNCTIINAKEGFVEVELTEQMNAAVGTLKCELKIYSTDGVLTTKQFSIEVTPSATSKTITSSNEFKALTDALKEVQRFEGRIDEIANKGTTTEVLKKTTEDYIQEKLDDGTIANLTLGNNAIKINNIDIESINIDDLYLHTKTVATGSQSNTYVFQYTKGTSSSNTLYMSFLIYNDSDNDLTFTSKVVDSNYSNPGELGLANGGVSIGGVKVSGNDNLKRGFNILTYRYDNVQFKNTYLKFVLTITTNITDSNYKVYINTKDVANFLTLDSISPTTLSLVEFPYKILTNENLNLRDKLLKEEDIITDILKKEVEKSKINVNFKSFLSTNGGMLFPTVVLDKKIYEILKSEYDGKIPKGTIFKYTLKVVANNYNIVSGNTFGLQVIYDSKIDGSSWSGGIKHSFGRKQLSSDINEFEGILSNDITINEDMFTKIFLDFGISANFLGDLYYSDFDIILPNGMSIAKIVNVTSANCNTINPYWEYANDKIVTVDTLNRLVNNNASEVKDLSLSDNLLHLVNSDGVKIGDGVLLNNIGGSSEASADGTPNNVSSVDLEIECYQKDNMAVISVGVDTSKYKGLSGSLNLKFTPTKLKNCNTIDIGADTTAKEFSTKYVRGTITDVIQNTEKNIILLPNTILGEYCIISFKITYDKSVNTGVENLIECYLSNLELSINGTIIDKSYIKRCGVVTVFSGTVEYINLRNTLLYSIPLINSLWNKKTYLAIGDSVTASGGGKNGVYPTQVAKALGLELIGHYASGKYMSLANPGHSMMNEYKKITYNVDLITIALGVNDAGAGGSKAELGTIDSTDTKTFLGAYNTLLTHIFKSNPYVTVVLIPPIYGTNPSNETLTPYREGVKALADKYYCHYFDINRMGINALNYKTFTDGLHIGETGHSLYAMKLTKFLSNI